MKKLFLTLAFMILSLFSSQNIQASSGDVLLGDLVDENELTSTVRDHKWGNHQAITIDLFKKLSADSRLLLSTPDSSSENVPLDQIVGKFYEENLSFDHLAMTAIVTGVNVCRVALSAKELASLSGKIINTFYVPDLLSRFADSEHVQGTGYNGTYYDEFSYNLVRNILVEQDIKAINAHVENMGGLEKLCNALNVFMGDNEGIIAFVGVDAPTINKAFEKHKVDQSRIIMLDVAAPQSEFDLFTGAKYKTMGVPVDELSMHVALDNIIAEAVRNK